MTDDHDWTVVDATPTGDGRVRSTSRGKESGYRRVNGTAETVDETV